MSSLAEKIVLAFLNVSLSSPESDPLLPTSVFSFICFTGATKVKHIGAVFPDSR